MRGCDDDGGMNILRVWGGSELLTFVTVGSSQLSEFDVWVMRSRVGSTGMITARLQVERR